MLAQMRYVNARWHLDREFWERVVELSHSFYFVED